MFWGVAAQHQLRLLHTRGVHVAPLARVLVSGHPLRPYHIGETETRRDPERAQVPLVDQAPVILGNLVDLRLVAVLGEARVGAGGDRVQRLSGTPARPDATPRSS